MGGKSKVFPQNQMEHHPGPAAGPGTRPRLPPPCWTTTHPHRCPSPCLTQGLDPASRQNLWGVVKQAKRERGIIVSCMVMRACAHAGMSLIFGTSLPRHCKARLTPAQPPVWSL